MMTCDVGQTVETARFMRRHSMGLNERPCPSIFDYKAYFYATVAIMPKAKPTFCYTVFYT
jgi:hypothetical protein